MYILNKFTISDNLCAMVIYSCIVFFDIPFISWKFNLKGSVTVKNINFCICKKEIIKNKIGRM